MFAAAVRAEVRRIVVDQFNIRNKASTCIGAFDQIVTQQRIFREAVLQSFMQRVHFVNAFARENSFTEQILIDV